MMTKWSSWQPRPPARRQPITDVAPVTRVHVQAQAFLISTYSVKLKYEHKQSFRNYACIQEA